MNIHTNENIEAAMEMSDALENFSNERIVWLCMKSELKNISEFSPPAILIGEMIRRLAPHLTDAIITHDGWILADGTLVSYGD